MLLSKHNFLEVHADTAMKHVMPVAVVGCFFCVFFVCVCVCVFSPPLLFLFLADSVACCEHCGSRSSAQPQGFERKRKRTVSELWHSTRCFALSSSISPHTAHIKRRGEINNNRNNNSSKNKTTEKILMVLIIHTVYRVLNP